MSQTLVRASPLPTRQWRRLGTLAAEQALISLSPYTITWTFVHTSPPERLPEFYLAWLWGWGLFAVLSQLVILPAQVLRADRELPDQALSDVVLFLSLGVLGALGLAAAASLAGLGLLASGGGVLALALAALAFFARRLQADDRPFGLVPQAAGYLLLAAAGAWLLATAGWFTPVVAITWASVALLMSALCGAPGRPSQARAAAVRLLRRVWPQGRWYAIGTVMRTVLYSSGLMTLIRLQRGATETAVVSAMMVLVGPLTVIGTVLPWAHLPELRSARGDRARFRRVWLRQLTLYVSILAAAVIGLSALWDRWVHTSAGNASLAVAVTAQRPSVLALLVSLVLTSWSSTALLALDREKPSFVILAVSGAAAIASVVLGAPSPVSVTLPYAFSLVLGVGVVLATLRKPKGGSG